MTCRGTRKCDIILIVEQKGVVFLAVIIKDVSIYFDGKLHDYKGLCIENDRIKYITNDEKIIDNFQKLHDKCDVISGKDKIAMPGLVNCHTHSPMTVLRNIGSDLPLHRWLFEEIFPREAKLTPEIVYNGSLYGQIEMIKSGTVEFIDMYDPFDSLATAVSESGMRASVSIATLHNDWSSGKRVTNACFEETEQILERWKKFGNDKLTPLCEIHSIYLYDTAFLPDVVKFAKAHNMGINMHLHETEKEIDEYFEVSGIRPIEYFESIGAFEVDVAAAHCTYMTEEDMKIMKKYNVLAAVNITSNLKLAGGIPNLPEMLKNNLRIGLGTDGCASNNNLNMFEEMHLAGILYKGLTKDATMVSPKQVIDMATCGKQIKEGSVADIILIDMREPHLNPINDIEASIVYSMQGSDVDTTIVGGEVLMKNRQLTKLDEEKIRYFVNNIKL